MLHTLSAESEKHSGAGRTAATAEQRRLQDSHAMDASDRVAHKPTSRQNAFEGRPSATLLRSMGNQAALRTISGSSPTLRQRCACKDKGAADTISASRPQMPSGGSKKEGVVHGAAGGANRFDDCPPAWKTKANAAQKVGSSWLANVVSGLSSLPRPIPAPVANLLSLHFHTNADPDIKTITARFNKLNTAINQSIDFECETSCDTDVLGYVYSVWSDLHVCPYWFRSDPDLQTSTVVHELAHDVVGCDDNAYTWETAKYAALSPAKAMNNADSYAHFAWDAFKP